MFFVILISFIINSVDDAFLYECVLKDTRSDKQITAFMRSDELLSDFKVGNTYIVKFTKIKDLIYFTLLSDISDVFFEWLQFNPVNYKIESGNIYIELPCRRCGKLYWAWWTKSPGRYGLHYHQFYCEEHRGRETNKNYINNKNANCSLCNVFCASLEIHHIVPYKDFRESKDWLVCNDRANLIALCKECHKKFTLLQQKDLYADFIPLLQSLNSYGNNMDACGDSIMELQSEINEKLNSLL